MKGWAWGMAYIVLHHIDSERERARYYALTWQPALTGDWAVERQWGPLDSRRRQSTVNLVEDQDKALALVIRHLRRRLRHGYHLVTLDQAELVVQAVEDLTDDTQTEKP